MRKPLVLALAAAAVAGGTALATPASAACATCSGTTLTAFAVVDGVLAITTTPVAAGASVGETPPTTVTSGSTVTATVPLGATTVLDTRIGSTGWSASAAAGTFTLTGGSATIPASAAKFYVPAAPTAVNVSTNLPTISNRATTPTGSNGSATLFDAAASGINGAVYTPVMQVTIPASTAVGVYTGTVTQSVS